MTRLIFLALAPVVLLGAWLAEDVVLLLYGGDYRAAAPAVVVLLLGTLVAVPGTFLATAMFAAGHQGRAGVPELFGLFATVPALVVLVPAYGATGAAVASTLSYTVTSAIAVCLFCRHSGLFVAAVLVPRKADVTALRGATARLRQRRR